MAGGHRSGCRSLLARSDRSSAVPQSRHVVQLDALSSAQLSKMLCMAIDRLNFRVDTSDNPAKQNRSVCSAVSDALIARFDSGQLISRVQLRSLQPVLAQLQEVLAQFIESGLSWEERQEHNGHLVRAASWPYPATSAPGLGSPRRCPQGGATFGSSLRDRMLCMICRSTAF